MQVWFDQKKKKNNRLLLPMQLRFSPLRLLLEAKSFLPMQLCKFHIRIFFPTIFILLILNYKFWKVFKTNMVKNPKL